MANKFSRLDNSQSHTRARCHPSLFISHNVQVYTTRKYIAFVRSMIQGSPAWRWQLGFYGTSATPTKPRRESKRLSSWPGNSTILSLPHLHYSMCPYCIAFVERLRLRNSRPRH
jgi:hypothetical protein